MERIKYENLIVEKSGPIVTVTMNRPEKLNAWDLTSYLDLKNLVADLRRDTKSRVVIMTGAGRAFSAGRDISKEAEEEHPNERIFLEDLCEIMQGFENLDQITIAAINGLAVGEGACIAARCDFRIASEKAYFNIPEASLGIVFSHGCAYNLLSLVGPANTRRMVILCDKISAQEALGMGLVDKVVPPEKLMDAATEMAEKIAAKAPSAIRVNKKIINAASVARMEHMCLCENELVSAVQSSAGEFEEGLQAYRERRQPKFTEI